MKVFVVMPRLSPTWFHLLMKLTGGRPMRRVALMFPDVVSGKPVHCYVDAFGRYWLAEHRWALFRVPASINSR